MNNKPSIKSRFVAFGVLLCLAASPLALAACGNDAKVESRDKTSATLLNMPDQFDTVAVKCDGHGHRVFEASGGGLTVIADQACNHVGP